MAFILKNDRTQHQGFYNVGTRRKTMTQKYPAGAIRQHHALATGAPLAKCDESDKGGGFKSDGPAAKPSSIKKSGTSTGSRK